MDLKKAQIHQKKIKILIKNWLLRFSKHNSDMCIATGYFIHPSSHLLSLSIFIQFRTAVRLEPSPTWHMEEVCTTLAGCLCIAGLTQRDRYWLFVYACSIKEFWPADVLHMLHLQLQKNYLLSGL